MKRFIIILLLVLISVSVFAVSWEGPISADGSYWITLDTYEKGVYVTGVLSGLCYANIYYKGYPVDYIDKVTVEYVAMLILALDDIYSKPENRVYRIVDYIIAGWATIASML